MDKVSLTYFVDFVLRSGTPKITGVREYKERRDELCTDFYRPVRTAIVEMHRRGQCEAVLDQVVAEQTDETRRRHFAAVVAGHRKFLASGDKRFFEPPRTGLRIAALELDINPELGLLIDGKPHFVKLHLRSEPLGQKRTAVILSLLSRALGDGYPGHTCAVLDVRNAKLCTAAPNPRIETLLRGEAASFAAIYASL
jgi:hypothetical protein